MDEKAFEEKIKDWEWGWVNGRETYADTAKRDAGATAKQLWAKYWKAILETYGLSRESLAGNQK